MAQGITSKPPAPKKDKSRGKGKEKGQQLQGLTKQQNRVINQTQKGDLSLGKSANQLLPGINDSLAQPFDFSQYKGPGADDYKGFITQQMGNYNQAYDARNNPIFQQQIGDFEQTMANRGIPMGSELYNREKSRIEQSQADQRQQAYAENQGQASQAANSFFNIGSQANQNNFTMDQNQRYGGLSDYTQLMGAQSGMANQNLGYSQQKDLQTQGEANQRYLQAHEYHGKGGGGGGGSDYGGFGSQQAYWDAQDARSRANAEYDLQLQQKYRPKAPSSGSTLLGQLGGAVLGGFAQNGFKFG
jgi:hypothetical protein